MHQPHASHESPIELLRRRAQALCADILSLAPADSVRGVFLGGSAARGDVWAARVDGNWEVYSDLDVYVVAARESALRAVRAQARAANARLPAVSGGVRFLRGAEVGVYTIEDLAAQPVRPGTVGLAERSFWLSGDRAILDALPPGEARAMARDEALYLLENRIAELSSLEPPVDPPHERLTRVLALKTRLDVGAAHLIANGSYPLSTAARVEAMRARAPATMPPGVLFDLEDAFADYGRLDDYVRAGTAPAAVEHAIALAADAWRILAARVLGANGCTTAALVNRRCARRCYWNNYREFVRLRHATGVSRAQSAVRGLRMAGFAPRAALRTHALVVALRRTDPHSGRGLATVARHVERLTRALGFSDGPLERRAAAAHRAIS